MTEVHPTPSHGGKLGAFLQQSTAGLPNWAWLLVIAGGITAAIVIPKYLNRGQTTSTTSTSPSGLGLAVDPTTGLPYAVEGLVPSGAGVQNTSSPPPVPTTPPGTAPTTTTETTTRVTRGLNPGETFGPGSAVPVWAKPDAVRINNQAVGIGGIPNNTTIQVGAPVTGNYFGQPAQYYPVSYNGVTGYIGAWDLAESKGSTGPRTSWPQNYTRSRHIRVA